MRFLGWLMIFTGLAGVLILLSVYGIARVNGGSFTEGQVDGMQNLAVAAIITGIFGGVLRALYEEWRGW